MGKLLLSGNEAIALGAYEAGVKVGTGYPGTPSSEILEMLTKYPQVYTEWSVNEKVAFEVALGAAFAGVRTLVTMKHVGLNVAADPLFTSSYTGIKGGLVVVSADDPQIHSSQNEQDNRNYAYAAKVPMLDPADSQEAKEFCKLGFEISEKYDTPVILRITTRIAHSKTIVSSAESPCRQKKAKGFERNIKKFVMIPAHARLRHVFVEERQKRLKKDVNGFPVNRLEINSKEVGFICSGISYTYLKEIFPMASILKLGLVHPLPEELITQFCNKVAQIFVVEELDPFIELRINAMGFKVQGKKYLPLVGELTPDIIRDAFIGIVPASIYKVNKSSTSRKKLSPKLKMPPRPPSLCPGCPHQTVFKILNKHKVTVSGDIGCYTLGVLPPYNAMDTCVEMGGSIGVAQGIEIAMGKDYKYDTVAVIGDSTFAHSGITGLLNAAYNKRHSLIIILDNGTTAMTGMQPNPLSGERINGEKTIKLNYRKLAQAVGLTDDNVKIVAAYNKKELEAVIPVLLKKRSLSLLVVQGLCIILKRRKKRV